MMLGAGANCGCYDVIVPRLRGHQDDPDRTIMYWLHRHVFEPLNVSIGQSGWEAGMAVLPYLPFVLVLLFCVVVHLLVRRWLARWYPLSPADWYPYCPSCLYNLTGNVSGICPECGAAVPGRVAGKRDLSPPSRARR